MHSSERYVTCWQSVFEKNVYSLTLIYTETYIVLSK